MIKKLTVGELKNKLKNIPDDLEVELWSDSGVDQSDDGDFEVIVEDAFIINNGFAIYANYVDEMEGGDEE